MKKKLTQKLFIPAAVRLQLVARVLLVVQEMAKLVRA